MVLLEDLALWCFPLTDCNQRIQAVMGSIVKGPLCKALGLQPGNIYHCAIMPCYDKKLEASREDFNVPSRCPPSVPHPD